MLRNFESSLSKLKHGSVRVSATNGREAGCASIQLLFENGSKLRAEYWRVVKGGRAGISSFDHQQQYGLSAPIDALKELQQQLQNKSVTDAVLETGDLRFRFEDNIELQVFNFTSYEVWEITFHRMIWRILQRRYGTITVDNRAYSSLSHLGKSQPNVRHAGCRVHHR